MAGQAVTNQPEEKMATRDDAAASKKKAVANQPEGKMATRDDAATSNKKRDVEELLKAHQVDVSKSENRVWVWKVTPPVYKAWQTTFTKKEEEKEGGSLGSVFVIVDVLEGTKTVTGDIDPTMPSEMIKSSKHSEVEDTTSKIERQREITLEVPTKGSTSTPETYSLVNAENPGQMYICSETSEGKVSVDGTVFQKYDAKPRINSNRKYLDTSKSSKPKIKEYSGNDAYKPQMLKMTMAESGKKRLVKTQQAQQNKKVRMDPEKLQEMLFTLFEKQPRYTFSELATQTAQPQDFLKKSLDEICVKVREGNKLLYEIKPEYKNGNEE